jgi:sigma-B regulation protein RsbQ
VTFTSDNRRDLDRVTVPTLVLQSRDDAIAPIEVGRYVHAAIPGSTFELMETTGHVAILSAPDDVSSRVRRFLA